MTPEVDVQRAAIIGATGLIMWFPVFFSRFLPGWAINIALIVHSDEALLAAGFIIKAGALGVHIWLPGAYMEADDDFSAILSAVIFDRELAMAMGLNVSRVYIVTFVIGAMLGALGGAYIAPTVSVAPGFGVDVIVLSFAVVVIGGMGSVPGAMIGALAVGIVRALAVHKFPQFELFVIYAVMATVLVFRPEGLFAPVKARKI